MKIYYPSIIEPPLSLAFSNLHTLHTPCDIGEHVHVSPRESCRVQSATRLWPVDFTESRVSADVRPPMPLVLLRPLVFLACIVLDEEWLQICKVREFLNCVRHSHARQWLDVIYMDIIFSHLLDVSGIPCSHLLSDVFLYLYLRTPDHSTGFSVFFFRTQSKNALCGAPHPCPQVASRRTHSTNILARAVGAKRSPPTLPTQSPQSAMGTCRRAPVHHTKLLAFAARTRARNLLLASTRHTRLFALAVCTDPSSIMHSAKIRGFVTQTRIDPCHRVYRTRFVCRYQLVWLKKNRMIVHI